MSKSKTQIVKVSKEKVLRRKIAKKAYELALKDKNPYALKAKKFKRLWKKYLEKAIKPYYAKAKALVLQKENEE
jgi:hypothetical protein